MEKQPPQVFYKKDVSKNFAKFTAKQLCRSFFFDKMSGIKPPTLLKLRLRRGCFAMNFARFLSTHFVWNTPRPPKQLLLPLVSLNSYKRHRSFQHLICLFLQHLRLPSAHFLGNLLIIEAAIQVFRKNAAMKNFAKFTGKHVCQSV